MSPVAAVWFSQPLFQLRSYRPRLSIKKTLTGRRKPLLTHQRMEDGVNPARQFYRPEGLLEKSHR